MWYHEIMEKYAYLIVVLGVALALTLVKLED